MSLSWIDESVEEATGGSHAAIIKRPDTDNLPLPLASNLSLPATTCGRLEKLGAPSWFGPHWQQRYFELRGIFVFYYADHAGLLLGALDLSRFERVSVSRGHLVLVSGDHEVCLRRSSVHGGGEVGVAEWSQKISEVLDKVKSERRKAALQSARRSMEDPHLSGALAARVALSKIQGTTNNPTTDPITNKPAALSSQLGEEISLSTDPVFFNCPAPIERTSEDVSLGKMFGKQSDQTPTSVSSMHNPLSRPSSTNTSLAADAVASDIELGSLAHLSDTTADNNDGATAGEAGISKYELHSLTRGSTQHEDGGADASLPADFVKLLVQTALQPKDGSQTVTCGMQRKRILFYLSYILSPLTVLRPYLLGTAPKCETTLVPNSDSGNPPCLFQACLVIPVVCISISSIISYTWLLRNGDVRIILRTHRERMRTNLSKFTLSTKRFFGFYILANAFTIVFRLSTTFETSTWYALVALLLLLVPLALFIIYIFCSLILPLILTTILYYAASRRLRLMLKDFLKLLEQRPFNFSAVSSAYTELAEEWEMTQMQLGHVISIQVLCAMLSTISYSVFFFYIDSGLNAHNGGSSLENLMNAALGLIVTVPLLSVNMFTMIGANQRAESIAEACTALITESSENSEHPNVQIRSDGNANSGDSSAPALNDLVHGASVAGVDGISAIKLTMLVDRRPCELRLLGRAFTYEDILGYMAFLVVIQLANVLGVGDIVFGG